LTCLGGRYRAGCYPTPQRRREVLGISTLLERFGESENCAGGRTNYHRPADFPAGRGRHDADRSPLRLVPHCLGTLSSKSMETHNGYVAGQSLDLQMKDRRRPFRLAEHFALAFFSASMCIKAYIQRKMIPLLSIRMVSSR
jgi:hypothetical protein